MYTMYMKLFLHFQPNIAYLFFHKLSFCFQKHTCDETSGSYKKKMTLNVNAHLFHMNGRKLLSTLESEDSKCCERFLLSVYSTSLQALNQFDLVAVCFSMSVTITKAQPKKVVVYCIQ